MKTHGIPATYSAGCRCDPCRQAATKQSRDLRRARPTRPGGTPHGTAGGYRNWACRCQLCRDAHLASKRARRAAGRPA